MSKMLDDLHRIRAEHHERVRNSPLHALVRPFPGHCSHCGHQRPVVAPFTGTPTVNDAYRIVEILSMEGGKATARIESPPCSVCGKTTTFIFEC